MNSEELAKKATRVITSCTNREQLNTAQKYAELFFERTRDIENFRKLVIEINKMVDVLA
jgi:hypothetical protein